MDEVRIHTGTRVKLKRLDDSALPPGFREQLRRLAEASEVVQAAYLFALQPAGQAEEISLAVGVKGGLLARSDRQLQRIVDEIQRFLPEGLALKVYRLDTSPLIAHYCYDSLEPLYLRNPAWLERQRRALDS